MASLTASLTPEGSLFRCPVCADVPVLELTESPSAGLCPRCGLLLRQVRDRLAAATGFGPRSIQLTDRLREDLGLDSLDDVEFVMELEEDFGVNIPDDAAQDLTVENLLRFLSNHRKDDAA